MNSDISKRTRAFSLPNMNWARVRATSVLPTPVGPRNKNDPMGRFGLLARPRTADGARQGADSFVLRDDAFVQLFFYAQQLLRFFFFNRGDGNAGPAAYHILDVLPTDYAGGGFIEVVFFAKGAQVLALLAFFVRVEARLLELVVRDGVLHAMDDELDALLHFRQFFRQRGLAQLYARPGLVDQVDGLIRQKAVGNIAVGMRHGKIDGV